MATRKALTSNVIRDGTSHAPDLAERRDAQQVFSEVQDLHLGGALGDSAFRDKREPVWQGR